MFESDGFGNTADVADHSVSPLRKVECTARAGKCVDSRCG